MSSFKEHKVMSKRNAIWNVIFSPKYLTMPLYKAANFWAIQVNVIDISYAFPLGTGWWCVWRANALWSFTVYVYWVSQPLFFQRMISLTTFLGKCFHKILTWVHFIYTFRRKLLNLEYVDFCWKVAVESCM